MIDLLLTSTMYAMCSLCILQPNLYRGLVSSLFALFIFLHDALFSGLDGSSYFLSAAVFDLVIIYIISKVTPRSELCFRLQLVCFVSIIINGIGFIMWIFYMEPFFYNCGIIALNIYAIYCLISRDNEHGRDREIHSNLPFILSYFVSRNKPNIRL